MPENDFEIFDRGKDGDRTLSVKKKWSKRIGKVVVGEQITSLTLSSLGGWKDSDLCFLEGLEQLRRVYIHSERTLDLSPLLALPNLRDLSLRAKCSKAVDLAGLKNLRSLSFDWCPALSSAFGLKRIKDLKIFRYPHEDLSQLGQMHELRSILVWSTKLLRLQGIEQLKKLRTAEFTYCRNLSDISVVGGIRSLRSLTFAHCKRLNDLQPIAKSKGLEELLIQNCGEIDSLKPVEKCRGLKTLQVSDNCFLMDGDFSSLKNLPKLCRVLIRHRAHYSDRDFDIERK